MYRPELSGVGGAAVQGQPVLACISTFELCWHAVGSLRPVPVPIESGAGCQDAFSLVHLMLNPKDDAERALGTARPTTTEIQYVLTIRTAGAHREPLNVFTPRSHRHSCTSRTFCVRAAVVNGLPRKCIPAASTPWRPMAFSV
jgi:hypothetical protein